MKKTGLNAELREIINSRLLIIIDVTLDSVVIAFIILNFYLIEKFAIFLEYENPFVIRIIYFAHDPIIILSSLVIPTFIRFFKKDSFLPNNSNYKIEIEEEPDNLSIDVLTKSDTPPKNKTKKTRYKKNQI